MSMIGSRPGTVRIGAGVAGVLVAAAGGLEVAGQLRRWSPCVGDYEAWPCQRIQSHEYDTFLPTPPWTPVGAGVAWLPIPGAAAPAGVAFLLLALALVLTRSVLGPVRSRGDRITLGAWIGLIVLVAGVGVVNTISGLTGTTLAATPTVGRVWLLLAPLLGVGLAIRTAFGAPADPVAWVLAAVLAVIAFRGSILEFFVALAGYGSYDTPPFNGMPAAVASLVLGALLAVLALRPRRPN